MSEDKGSITAKLHRIGHQNVLAVADTELIGRILDNNGVPFSVNGSFYGNEAISEDDLLILIRSSSNMNIIGELAIRYLLEIMTIDSEDIIMIDGHPHIQIYHIF